MKATEFLNKAASLLEERGKQYDQPQGERSMGKAVTAFNAITSRDLSEAEGWLLLQLLKDVRQWQNPDRYHADSAEDCVSYAALKAEALASVNNDPMACSGCVSGCFRCWRIDEPALDIDDDSPRAQVIGQNGEMASEVYAAIDGKPSWSCAPKWAMWLTGDEDGEYWYETEPEIDDDGCWELGLNYQRASAKTCVTPWKEARPCQ